MNDATGPAQPDDATSLDDLAGDLDDFDDENPVALGASWRDLDLDNPELMLADEAAYLEAWDEAAGAACAVLCGALAEFRDADPPDDAIAAAAAAIRDGVADGGRVWELIATANGWDVDGVPDDDPTVVAWAIGALVIMEEDPELSPEDEATIMTLEFGDWLGAVCGLVRGGVGTSAEPSALVGYINACDEVEGEIPADDAGLVEAAFGLVLPTWHAAGALDTASRLTELGHWMLPRVFAMAWGGDFDDPDGTLADGLVDDDDA